MVRAAVQSHIVDLIVLYDEIRRKHGIGRFIPIAQALYVLIVIEYATAVGLLVIIAVKDIAVLKRGADRRQRLSDVTETFFS